MKTSGFIYFPSNFTESLFFFNTDDDETSNYLTDDGFLQVRLDNSFVPKSLTIRKEIYDTYERFTKELITACRGRNSPSYVPITFDGMFGKIVFHLKNSAQSAGVVS